MIKARQGRKNVAPEDHDPRKEKQRATDSEDHPWLGPGWYTGGAMEKVQVSLGEWVVGCVHCDTLANEFHGDTGVPTEVVSDVEVTYFRDHVLFGRSGDGYSWAEVG
jgi:hypothetical protein